MLDYCGSEQTGKYLESSNTFRVFKIEFLLEWRNAVLHNVGSFISFDTKMILGLFLYNKEKKNGFQLNLNPISAVKVYNYKPF